MDIALPRLITSCVASFRSVESYAQTAGGSVAIIELLLGQQSITVKWPTSDPDGCARFFRGLTQ